MDGRRTKEGGDRFCNPPPVQHNCARVAHHVVPHVRRNHEEFTGAHLEFGKASGGIGVPWDASTGLV